MSTRRASRLRLGSARIGGVAVVLGALSLASAGDAHPARAAGSLPPIKHVWVVMLENEDEANAWVGGTASAQNRNPYLPYLVSQGALIRNYYGVGHLSADNYIGLISGEPPTTDSQSDCQNYDDGSAETGSNQGPNAGEPQTGCIYAGTGQGNWVATIGDALDKAPGHPTWKGYMEDLGLDTSSTSPHNDNLVTCNPPTGSLPDPTQHAEGADQYALRHDPFMYFHTVIDDASRCRSHVVRLQHNLLSDLSSVSTTPSFSLVVPNLCDDGHDGQSSTSSTCAGPDALTSGLDSTVPQGSDPCGEPGYTVGNGQQAGPGGLVSIDHWLCVYVPSIISSPAFRQDGMLVITFDEASGNGVGQGADENTACCDSWAAGNGSNNGVNGPGGGKIGALVISPFVNPGTQVQSGDYNHFSLLRTIQDIFGATTLPTYKNQSNTPLNVSSGGYLGMAGASQLPTNSTYAGPCDQNPPTGKGDGTCTGPLELGSAVFTNPLGTALPAAVPGGGQIAQPSTKLNDTTGNSAGTGGSGALPGLSAALLGPGGPFVPAVSPAPQGGTPSSSPSASAGGNNALTGSLLGPAPPPTGGSLAVVWASILIALAAVATAVTRLGRRT